MTDDFLDVIESPFPYIIGVSRATWDQNFALSLDQMNFDDYFFQNTIIFDIDQDFLKMKYDNEIPKEKTH